MGELGVGRRFDKSTQRDSGGGYEKTCDIFGKQMEPDLRAPRDVELHDGETMSNGYERKNKGWLE